MRTFELFVNDRLFADGVEFASGRVALDIPTQGIKTYADINKVCASWKGIVMYCDDMEQVVFDELVSSGYDHTNG